MGIFIKELSQEGMSYQEYLAYVESIREKLPPTAYEYATAEWHYNMSHPSCIHDAWLQTLTITEISGERPEAFHIEISFLNGFEDRLLKFSYKDVTRYEMITPSQVQAHSDVYFDEVRLADKNNVAHEILFMSNARWVIECKDFLFREEPLIKKH